MAQTSSFFCAVPKPHLFLSLRSTYILRLLYVSVRHFCEWNLPKSRLTCFPPSVKMAAAWRVGSMADFTPRCERLQAPGLTSWIMMSWWLFVTVFFSFRCSTREVDRLDQPGVVYLLRSRQNSSRGMDVTCLRFKICGLLDQANLVSAFLALPSYI